jgi:hypothetical protein
MEKTKPWYKSKTIWGAIVTVIFSLLSLFTNINVSEQMKQQAVDLIMNTVTLAGGILAFIGRLKADAKIGSGGNK